jgi:O-phosphoseryl-tRNA(Cys) synthetase
MKAVYYFRWGERIEAYVYKSAFMDSLTKQYPFWIEISTFKFGYNAL